MNNWKTLRTKEVYDNPWINVTESDVLNPSGGDGIYGVVHFKNIAVGVVPIDEEGNTWLVGQWRYTLDEYSWEIAEGGCKIGEEEPLEAAQRELLEETGIIAQKYTQILKLHTSNSVTDEVGYVFLAEGLSFTDAEPEETEDLKVLKISIEEAANWCLDGKITDAISVAAILACARDTKFNMSQRSPT